MAVVRMVVQITGTRDGADWPPPGETVDVPDSEAEALVSAGVAEPVEEAAKPRARRSSEG